MSHSYRYDARQIASMLASRAEEVCRWLLPTGKRVHNEYVVGNIDGGEGDSLRINLAGKAGVWEDFACPDHKGNLISLIMYTRDCNAFEAVKTAKEFLGIADDTKPHFARTAKTYKKPPKQNYVPSNNALAYLKSRGISEKTVNDYGVKQVNRSDIGPSMAFPCYFDGEVALIKYRAIDKKEIRASAESKPCLFGWQAMPKSSNFVVITEGEIDAMSFAEMGTWALSVPFGGGDGDKQNNWIEEEYEHLQNFSTIFLALDNDDVGQQAARHIAKRLGEYRCYKLDLGGYKDANDALRAGFDISVASDIWKNAKPYDPEELAPAGNFKNKVLDIFLERDKILGDLFPWDNANRKGLRLRDGETTIWAGISGHGKSQLVNHVAINSIFQGKKWCIASMEFKPEKLLARLLRQALGVSQPRNDDDWQAFWNFVDDRLWLFDVQGTAKSERILEVFEYAYKKHGITCFLIDSLAKCGFAEDDYNAQKAFVDKLSDFARNNGVQIHLVCHSRKSQSEENIPDKFDIKGTGAITDMVDNVFIVWRNKPKERAIDKNDHSKDDESDCELICCKNREGDWEGAVHLFFDKASFQYYAKGAHILRYC